MKTLLRGAKTLTRWWLQGQRPVGQLHAQARANICNHANGKGCYLNLPAQLYEAPGKAIKAAFELKLKMTLRVEEEERLGVCDACGCYLKLKVWTPEEIVQKDVEGYMNKLPAHCWIRSERTKL